MIILTQYLPSTAKTSPHFTLYLTSEERTKIRQQIETPEGETVFLNLPRGTVLKNGDFLQNDTKDVTVCIGAQPEEVMTVKAQNNLDLLKAAYYLGNRHVPLEITTEYLRFPADKVLSTMLIGLGLDVKEEVAPFNPASGAYGASR